MRTRVKFDLGPASAKSTDLSNGYSSGWFDYHNVSERFDDFSSRISSLTKPERPCSHHKVIKTCDGSATTRYPDGTPAFLWEYKNFYNLDSAAGFIQTYVGARIAELIHIPRPEFQKNNGFEIINFLAEIDDTLAMFSLNFIKSLFSKDGFGAVNWGVLPLISDLKALYASLDDLFSGSLAKSLTQPNPCHVACNVTIPRTLVPGGSCAAQGVLRLRGETSFDPITPFDAFAVLLDEIGLHPDAKSIWDLVPFSFVVDYFLPIGDTLEALHPRGWFRPVVHFSGTVSFKGKTSFCPVPEQTLENPLNSPKFICDHYWRTSAALDFADLREPHVSLPQFKCPNLQQLFNTAYLALSRTPRKR